MNELNVIYESSERYLDSHNHLSSKLGAPYVLIDIKHNIIDCNNEQASLFNLSGKQEYIANCSTLSPVYQSDGVLSITKATEMIQEALTRGKCSFYWTHQSVDKDIIPVEVTLITIVQDDKQLIVGHTRDLREIIKIKKADKRMGIMFDSVPLCCNYWDINHNNIDCNEEAVKLFEVANKQEYLQKFFMLSPEYQPNGERTLDLAKVYLDKAFKEGKHVFKWMHQKLNGELIPAEITLLRIKDEDGVIVVGYTRDLREETLLQEANQKMQVMFDSAPLGCSYWDDHFNLVECNLETLNIFELNTKQEYIDNFDKLSPKFQPDGMNSLKKAAQVLKKVTEEGKYVFEWMHQTLDGKQIPTEITLVKDTNENTILSYTRDLRMIQDAVNRLELMEKIANIDPLTQCYNRRGLELLSKEQIKDYTVLLMDIDYFKNVNDTFGHQTGDEVLKNFAKIIQSACRKNDILIRYGGEEFLLVLVDTSVNDAYRIAEEVRKKTEKKLKLPDGTFATVSIGITSGGHKEDIEQCLHNADQALYESKQTGRNKTTLYSKK